MSHPIPVDPISVDELLTEYMALLRAGKCPDIEDFCRRPGTDAAILKPLLVTATSLEQTRQRIDSQSQQSTINTRRRDLPHHQLGDFRLLREAGRGGMGIVYEAVEITLQRRVALKILDARNASSPVWLKRFQLEARAAALLHHTNIVPVFSVGECENIHYYVMPFIDGDPLSKVLSTLREKSADSETRQILGTDLQSRKANSPDVAVDSNVHRSQISEPTLNTTATAELPSTTAARSMSQRFTATKQKEPAYFRRVATICLQVAEAMDHAYQQGVLHRDIKPGNLILAFDGTVWVTDFGLARMTDSDDLTNTGEILGTLRYLAPERLRGQHTVQGDIYGLGVTMYELLTLQTAFAASERPELLRRVMEETPESPRRIDPSIPRDLETIVTRSIAKEVLHRYQLPSELVTDLRMFLEDRPILSRRISTAEIVWRWCRKNPGVATLLSTVAALLIVIAVGAVLWGTSLQRERDAAQRAENAAKFSEQSALAERRKAISSEGVAIEARRLAEESDRQRRQELFDVYLNDMATRYESDLRGHRLDGLQLARNALEVLPLAERTSHQQSRLRNATIACLGHADFAEIEKHPAADQLGHAIDIDPALRVLALPGADQQTDLRWLDGSESDRTLTEDPIPDLAGCDRWFSPCGRWLVEVRIPMNQLPQLRIWDWQKSKLALQIDNASLHGTPCFHPDGRQFFVVENARIHVYDLETGERLRRSPPRFKFSRLAISHDGRYLSSLVPMHPPVIIDTASFAVIAPVSEFEHGGVAAWHTKKAVVLIGSMEGSVSLLDPIEQHHDLKKYDYANPVTELKYSPNGRFAAISTRDGNTHIHETDGDRELVVVSGELLQFSDDERRICVRTAHEINMFEFVPSPSFTSIRQQVRYADFSPDGNWLALSGNRGVLLYSTDPPTLQCNLGLDETGPVAWHPEMVELATFGMFSHLVRWPLADLPDSADSTIGPPTSAALNTVLARLGADDRVPQHWGRHAVWHPDGNQLFYADSRKSHVWRFDVATGKNEIFADLPSASFASVSPDGKWIAGATWPIECVQVWNAGTRESVLEVPGCGRAAFSADGKIIAIGSRSELRFYNTQNWNLIRSWSTDVLNPFHAAPLAFQPGGTLFAAAVSGHCVRLYNADTGEPIADLPMLEDADISWLSFSPDGARLAITRANRDVLIWNLHQLRNELHAIGLPAESLPMHEQTATNRQVRTLDRGQELLPPTGWWTGHEMLARYEALKLNYPDAIDRMDTALDVASPQDLILRSKLLMQRGEYHLLNNNPDEACADFREAVKFNPAEPANARRFVELLLFGPPDIRDPVEARRLLQDLVSLDEQNIQDRLNLILTDLHLHHLQTARIEFHQIADETVVAASPTARTAYRCVQICIERRSTAENVVVNPVDLQSSIAETQRLVDEARETASPNESAVLDEFCKLLEL
jgi:serine/threonine protein kinase/WD40 repeat protein